MRPSTRLLPVIAIACVLALAAGCGGGGQPWRLAQPGMQPTGVQADPARTVTVNGRSVAELWMKHWGFTGEGPVQKNGYYFDYKALDASSLSNLPGSFAQNTEGLAADSVAFFKFCFVDFNGEPQNLSELEGIVDQVVATSGQRGLRLVLGNAIPVQREGITPALRQEYAAFDSYLKQKASPGKVWVMDMYGALAGPDGALDPKFDSGDGHPNDAGFEALDARFFPLLQQVYGQ